MKLYSNRILAAIAIVLGSTPAVAVNKVNAQLTSIIRAAGYKCQEPVTEIEEELASAPQEEPGLLSVRTQPIRFCRFLILVIMLRF